MLDGRFVLDFTCNSTGLFSPASKDIELGNVDMPKSGGGPLSIPELFLFHSLIVLTELQLFFVYLQF